MRPATPFEGFLQEHHISTAEIARMSGLSRKHVTEIKKGRANETKKTQLRIATACQRKLRRPITIAEVFGLNEPIVVSTRKAS